MKTIAVLFLATFLAASAFGGGPACKVIIDYSSLRRSAAELSKLSEWKSTPLSAKALGLRDAADGGWVGALEALKYADKNPQAATAAHMKALLDEAYLVCEWAKTVRAWSVIVRAAKDGPLPPVLVAKWCAQMDEWMTKDEALIRTIGESDLPKGYVPPAVAASKFHAAE